MPLGRVPLVAVPSVLVRECTRTVSEPTMAGPVKYGFGIRGINACCGLGLDSDAAAAHAGSKVNLALCLR